MCGTAFNLRLTALAGLLIAGLAGGCATTGEQGLLGKLSPFGKGEPQPQIQTAADRIEALSQLADRADKLPASQQQEIVATLADDLVNEEVVLVRCQILRTLAEFKIPAADEPLAAGMQDAERDVRVACCEAWSKRGSDRAVQILSETASSDVDKDVRLAAARALGELKDPRGVAALGLMLEDQDPAVQYRAVQSLRRISGEDFGNDANAWRQYVAGKPPESPSFAARLRRWF